MAYPASNPASKPHLSNGGVLNCRHAEPFADHVDRIHCPQRDNAPTSQSHYAPFPQKRRPEPETNAPTVRPAAHALLGAARGALRFVAVKSRSDRDTRGSDR